MSNESIEPQDFLGGVTVIDIGDVRVARGMTRRPTAICRHQHLTYDQTERRIWCVDCETDVDCFDAYGATIEIDEADLERSASASAVSRGSGLQGAYVP